MRDGTCKHAGQVAGTAKEQPLRVSFVDQAGAALLRDPVPDDQARRVGTVRGEDGREQGPGVGRWECSPLERTEESESRIVPVARCSGSSGSSSEPYPGWKLIGEGVWAKGSYVVAGGPPFLLTKKVSIIHDEIVFETLAEYPTLEAAVMFVELNYEEPERDRLTMAILRSAINHVKGV